jgi:hypothetical protein
MERLTGSHGSIVTSGALGTLANHGVPPRPNLYAFALLQLLDRELGPAHLQRFLLSTVESCIATKQVGGRRHLFEYGNARPMQGNQAIGVLRI